MIPNPSDEQPTRGRARFQFRLSTLFLLMFAVSVVSGAAAGLLRQSMDLVSVSGGVHLAMLIAAPLAAMIVLSVYYAIVRWRGWSGPPKDDDTRDPP